MVAEYRWLNKRMYLFFFSLSVMWAVLFVFGESVKNTGHPVIFVTFELSYIWSLVFFLSGQRYSEIFLPGFRLQLLSLLSVVWDSGQLSERSVAGHVPSQPAIWFRHGGCLHLHWGPEVRVRCLFSVWFSQIWAIHLQQIVRNTRPKQHSSLKDFFLLSLGF